MMNRLDIVRAWKDEEYRMSLSEAERASLPENPAGFVQLNAAELEGAAGGNNLGINTSPVMCQINRTFFFCPPKSYAARPCPPRTVPPQCPPRTLPPQCPVLTHRPPICPPLSLRCPIPTITCPQ